MIQILLSRLCGGLRQSANELPLHAWTNEDSNWHGSSLELARGLEVTELPGASAVRIAPAIRQALSKSGRRFTLHGDDRAPIRQELSMVKAVWNGVVVAESDDTVIVEGNHYFPEASVRREHLAFSNHRSSCPWKGQARYHSLIVNGEMNTDAVWYYPDPSPAAANIQGRLAFWKGVQVG